MYIHYLDAMIKSTNPFFFVFISADHGLQLVLGTVEPNSPAWKAGLRYLDCHHQQHQHRMKSSGVGTQS